MWRLLSNVNVLKDDTKDQANRKSFQIQLRLFLFFSSSIGNKCDMVKWFFFCWKFMLSLPLELSSLFFHHLTAKQSNENQFNQFQQPKGENKPTEFHYSIRVEVEIDEFCLFFCSLDFVHLTKCWSRKSHCSDWLTFCDVLRERVEKKGLWKWVEQLPESNR